MQTKALYVHIPFCDEICSYCDFCKVYYDQNTCDAYLEALADELKTIPQNNMETIYIGGGTPSSLSLSELEKLFRMLKPYAHQVKEYTMEANPESLDLEKLKLMHSYGINRLSLGVQSFHDDLLALIERHHNRKMVEEVIKEAQEAGFENISIDLMYGLPHETIQDLKEDLEAALSLPITHISCYSLILEEHTKLYDEHYQTIDEDLDDEMNILIDERLHSAGFHKYEVSNYAKDGYESLHNKAYWHYDNYYGIGVGAAGKIDDDYIEHSRALQKYLRHEDIRHITHESREETIFNSIMMSLRLVEGLDLDVFEARYHHPIETYFPKSLEKHLERGNLVKEGHYLKTTPESIKYLNDILVDFLDEQES